MICWLAFARVRSVDEFDAAIASRVWDQRHVARLCVLTRESQIGTQCDVRSQRQFVFPAGDVVAFINDAIDFLLLELPACTVSVPKYLTFGTHLHQRIGGNSKDLCCFFQGYVVGHSRTYSRADER